MNHFDFDKIVGRYSSRPAANSRFYASDNIPKQALIMPINCIHLWTRHTADIHRQNTNSYRLNGKLRQIQSSNQCHAEHDQPIKASGGTFFRNNLYQQ